MFIYTKHAIKKMDSLGIEQKEVTQTIRVGMKWKEVNSEKWHAQMAGLEVVFMKQNNTFFIITIYLARRQK